MRGWGERARRVTACLTLALAAAAGAQDRAALLHDYLDALTRWRGGEETARAELLELGQRLCAEHDRCDARDVARHYAGLDPAALAQGLADEAAVDAVRVELLDAGHGGLASGQEWPVLRARLMDELRTLAAEIELRPDFAPAARARALLARLELSWIEEDPTLRIEERARHLSAAEAEVARSVELFEACGMVTPQLEPLWVRGRLARARGQRVAARRDQQRCHELALRVGSDDYRERALLALLQLARDEGDHAAVAERLAQLARFRDPAACWPLAREHAASLISADHPETALASLLAHPPQADAHQGEWHALLAAAYVRSGDLLAARREVQTLSGADEVAQLARAALLLAEGTPRDTLALLAQDEARVGWSAQGRAEAQVMIGEARLALGDPLAAERALAAALAEARGWSSAQAAGAGSVVGEWLGLHAIALLAQARAEQGDPLGAALLIEEVQTRRLRDPGERVDAAELLGWAARFELGLVTWSVGANGMVCAWVLPDGRAGAATSSHGRRAWRAAVRRLREAAIGGDDERTRALGQEVGDELFPAALRAALAGADPDDRLLLCLHGPLEGLPLGLVALEGQLLDARLTPLVLPGLPGARAVVPPPATTDATWRLLGAPDTEGVSALPGAARELAHLARLRPGARLASGAAFRRGALFEALASGDLLHIATHLVQDPGCEDARLAPVGLALSAREVVCAAEVLARGAPSPLVVLLACETAGGRPIDAEGTHGLARAFLEAGARNLVVTLWPVDDEAARAFALAFHAALDLGLTPSRAVHAARRTLADAGRSPADWAAFRALGRD